MTRHPIERGSKKTLIPITSNIELLGVTFNSTLSWNDHVENVCKKAAKRLHVLRKLKSLTSKEELHKVYKSSVRPVLEYCSPSFAFLTAKLEKRLQRVENRAHRIIFESKECHGHCGCNSLSQRRTKMATKLFTKIYNKRDHILRGLLPSRLPRSQKHSNFTCRTEKRKTSFFPFMTLFLNGNI